MLDILLATYNSEKFLKQQIESIIAQDFIHWKLIIRDGGSTDSTLKIIKQYCSSYPKRIFLLSNSSKSTALENFFTLLDATSSSPYIMFSDHDDVWLPNKVNRTISSMQNAEKHHEISTPILIFTDAYIVDEKLQVLSKSHLEYHNLNPEKTDLQSLLIQNIPLGCTTCINRALANKTTSLKKGIVMHDHWLTLVASVFGKVIYLDEPTLLYRQHTNNYFGVSKYNLKYLWNKLKEGRQQLQFRLLQNIQQAETFLNSYKNEMPYKTIQLLNAFISLPSTPFPLNFFKLLKYRILKHGLMRNLGMLYTLSNIKKRNLSKKTDPAL